MQAVEVYLALILLSVILIILNWLKKPEFPYYKNPYFLTDAEKTFLRVLQSAVNEQYYICCQVGVNSLVRINKKGREWWIHRDKLGQKSVDFVLLDKNSLEPKIAIELDDSSHLLSSRQKRDEFVDKVMEVAGIPLIRIKNQSNYTIQELRSKLQV